MCCGVVESLMIVKNGDGVKSGLLEKGGSVRGSTPEAGVCDLHRLWRRTNPGSMTYQQCDFGHVMKWKRMHPKHLVLFQIYSEHSPHGAIVIQTNSTFFTQRTSQIKPFVKANIFLFSFLELLDDLIYLLLISLVALTETRQVLTGLNKRMLVSYSE